MADVPIRIGDETVYADETGVFSLRITRKHAYKMQLLLERQIGAHYYEQVSGPTEVMAGTDETPGRAQFVVRVDQKKVPSLPKGGIVIGNANAALDGATGSGGIYLALLANSLGRTGNSSNYTSPAPRMTGSAAKIMERSMRQFCRQCVPREFRFI